MNKTYILVHGAWHGGWAWKHVFEKLTQEGHTVLTPDLPGHGEDRRPLSEMTMDAYVKRITGLLENQTEKVILAGHSMSGAVIAQAGERRPQKIEKLVYICAFLLPNGKSVLQVMEEDEGGEFGARLTFNEDQSGAKLDDATFRATFYNEASEEMIQWAKPQLLEYQPTAPLGTPIRITQENFGRLPRVYIKCMRDKVLSPRMQQKLIDDQPCEKVFEIEADHAPFVSKPDELSDILLKL